LLETPDGGTIVAELDLGIIGGIWPPSASLGINASLPGPNDLRADCRASEWRGRGHFEARFWAKISIDPARWTTFWTTKAVTEFFCELLGRMAEFLLRRAGDLCIVQMACQQIVSAPSVSVITGAYFRAEGGVKGGNL
jgi:hypothetical protein